MTFIVVTHAETGNYIRVNVDHVAFFGPLIDDVAVIVFANGDQLKVRENSDEIWDLIFGSNQ